MNEIKRQALRFILNKKGYAIFAKLGYFKFVK